MTARQYEDKVADWFRSRGNIVTNLNDTVGQYSKIDLMVMNSDGICSFIEVKRRDCKSTTYQDTMLETQKYNELYETGSGFYAVIFDDGIWMFDVRRKIPVRSGTVMCPATTSFQNNSKIPKEVVYWNISQGVKIN